ncbi:MAG TPA: carboxypeptidase-like regulatory domain-containing protein [archaeon]|nr:carboxypeptidase-like regulatory domain-containing protein [archaeon]
MGLKDFYYSLEEKWYGFWDKIDTHIPVYKILDPIDAIIPSLILFLVLILLLLAFGTFFFLSSNQVYEAKFTIISNTNEPIFDSLITAEIFEGSNFSKELTARTDASGEIIFSEIKKGSEVSFKINLNKGTYEGSFLVNENLDERIKLNAPPIKLSPVTKKIYARLATGQTLTQDVELNFSCEGSNTLTPTPSSATTSGEEIQVTEPVGCILKATINDSKYVPKSYYINSTIFDLFIEKPEPPTAKLTVKLREGGHTVGEKSFKVKATGDMIYDSTTSSASEAIMNITAGEYVLTITDPSGDYGLVTRNINVQKDTEIVIEVSREVKSRVTINVKDDSTKRAISDAIINVKNSSGKEIYSTTTNEDGVALVTFIDLGEYTFSAKKLGDTNGGYFSSSATMTISTDANLTLELEKITNSNLGKVKVIVKDQDNLPVMNARVMLKYTENEGIVELMQEKNYSLTDLNGETTFLAGKVTGTVYAYAIKSPFQR